MLLWVFFGLARGRTVYQAWAFCACENWPKFGQVRNLWKRISLLMFWGDVLNFNSKIKQWVGDWQRLDEKMVGERGHEQETRTGLMKVLDWLWGSRDIYLNSLVCVGTNILDKQNRNDRMYGKWETETEQELFPIGLERLLLPLLGYYKNKKEMLGFYCDENHRKL